MRLRQRKDKGFITVPDIVSGTKFISGLPAFLRNPVRGDEARIVLRSRFENRESDFLRLAAEGIYSNPASPYLRMLRLAGCDYPDLAELVKKEGVEQALRELFRSGVYLSVNEYKGRIPALRKTAEIEVGPGALVNPLSKSHLRLHTSGSTGRGIIVPVDLGYVRDRCVNHRLLMEARGGSRWHFAVWGIPGNTDLVRILELHGSGARPRRWFTQVEPNTSGLHPRYRWSIRSMHWAGRLTGITLPSPEYVPLSDPSPIVHWLRDVLDSGDKPHLTTWVSSAVRICQAASSLRIDISGTQFTVGGEPLTAARLALIQKSGAVPVPRFMSVECAYIGYGCLNPDGPDDYHSISDFTTVIQTGRDGIDRGFPPEALLVTSIRPTAPFILLNVSLGDQAQLVRRSCGCPLEALGWSNHFRTVRSFEKLTSGGMTFLDSDIVSILERVLPARFGGTALDYQLVEEETAEGNPQIHLLISPDVGPIDIEEVLQCFYGAIGKGSGAERVMSLQWKSAESVSIRRETPRTTQTGKILHLLKSSR
jgi:hypothetical protein